MTELVWDNVGDRTFETGLDKGVLYLPDGSAVPWNGLTSITEKTDKESSPVYYDGQKINDLTTFGDFSASMKAITYPDEFSLLEGMVTLSDGVYLGGQRPQSFGLCYRTRLGNDVDGDTAGYKIHLLYNVTAIPADKTYDSVSDNVEPMEFEWDISAIPEDLEGFRPSAHLVINSLDIHPDLLRYLEAQLYGDETTTPELPPMQEFVNFIDEWYVIMIRDLGNGVWSASTTIDGLIEVTPEGVFQIHSANAVYLDVDTYEISNSLELE